MRTGDGVELLDVDELLEAAAAGFLDGESAERAIRVALQTVDALARHDYDLGGWLRSRGMVLTWSSA